MRKSLTAALAALTFGAAVAATAAPAEARPYYGGGRYYSYHRHHGNDAGVAVAAGVVGLALGAALASDGGGRRYYDRGYYRGGYGYYQPGYGYYDSGYYDSGYAVCESRRWVYDPYIGRRVQIRSRYAC